MTDIVASSKENEASGIPAETESSASRHVAREEELLDGQLQAAESEEEEGGGLSAVSSSEELSDTFVSKAQGEGGKEVGTSESGQSVSATKVLPEGMWANRRWKTLHLLSPSTVGATGCGLVLSSATGEVVRSWPKVPYRICSRFGCLHNRVNP